MHLVLVGDDLVGRRENLNLDWESYYLEFYFQLCREIQHEEEGKK
jgi:hypothetical protein